MVDCGQLQVGYSVMARSILEKVTESNRVKFDRKKNEEYAVGLHVRINRIKELLIEAIKNSNLNPLDLRRSKIRSDEPFILSSKTSKTNQTGSFKNTKHIDNNYQAIENEIRTLRDAYEQAIADFEDNYNQFEDILFAAQDDIELAVQSLANNDSLDSDGQALLDALREFAPTLPSSNEVEMEPEPLNHENNTVTPPPTPTIEHPSAVANAAQSEPALPPVTSAIHTPPPVRVMPVIPERSTTLTRVDKLDSVARLESRLYKILFPQSNSFISYGQFSSKETSQSYENRFMKHHPIATMKNPEAALSSLFEPHFSHMPVVNSNITFADKLSTSLTNIIVTAATADHYYNTALHCYNRIESLSNELQVLKEQSQSARFESDMSFEFI